MTAGFLFAALAIVAGALAAVFLSNLIYCAFGLAICLLGIAILYLNLGAEFVAFSQVLVYVGAVAILIVFAILLTQREREATGRIFARQWLAGLAAAGIVFGILASSVMASRATREQLARPPTVTNTAAIGTQLMTRYLLHLEAAGLLLTVALIGGVIVALPGPRRGAKVGAAATSPASLDRGPSS